MSQQSKMSDDEEEPPKEGEGWVYLLHHEDLSVCPELYVGSTMAQQGIKGRMAQHKYSCNNPNGKGHNCPVYQCIRANGGWDDWQYEILEHYDRTTETDLLARERHFKELLHANLGVQTPGRTQTEYRAEYREERAAYDAQYYEENKERIAARQAQYNKDHREDKAAYDVKYRDKNREEIAAQRAAKVECECGCFISRANIAAHRKKPKHARLLAEKSN